MFGNWEWHVYVNTKKQLERETYTVRKNNGPRKYDFYDKK